MRTRRVDNADGSTEACTTGFPRLVELAPNVTLMTLPENETSGVNGPAAAGSLGVEPFWRVTANTPGATRGRRAVWSIV